MYYYGARYYDPRTSVWIGIDPMSDKYPGWSPYAYCLDNPIRFIDPNGMETGEPGGDVPWVNPPQKPKTEWRPPMRLPDSPDPALTPSSTPSTPKQPTSGNNGQPLKNVGDGLSAAGIAVAGTQAYTKANAPAKIAYKTITNATKNVSKTNVLTGLKATGNLLFGVSLVVDFSLSAMGEQSWGKTILNTGVGALPLLIGTGPGLAVGAGYTVLDKTGAFNIPANMSSYSTPLMPADATRVVMPAIIPIFQ